MAGALRWVLLSATATASAEGAAAGASSLFGTALPVDGCDHPVIDVHSTFIGLSGGADQLSQNVGTLSDLFYYARALGRVAVEPNMASSRIAPMYEAAQCEKEWCGKPLSDYLDLSLACRYTPTISADAFRALQLARPEWFGRGSAVDVWYKPTDHKLLKKRYLNQDDVRSFFARVPATARVIRMQHFPKSNVDKPREVLFALPHERTACGRMPCVPAFGFSRKLHALSESLAERAFNRAPYVCVQWRGENSLAHMHQDGKTFRACANRISRAFAAGARRGVPGFKGARALLVTDLLPGNSGTFHNRKEATTVSKDLLKRLPVNSTLQQRLAQVPDSGDRGILEVLMCAKAETLFGCDPRPASGFLRTDGQAQCLALGCMRYHARPDPRDRIPNSGFVESIVRLRGELVAANSAKGGGRPTRLWLNYTW